MLIVFADRNKHLPCKLGNITDEYLPRELEILQHPEAGSIMVCSV